MERHTSTANSVKDVLMWRVNDDRVEVETCRTVSDQWLFIIDCAVCWIKYCI